MKKKQHRATRKGGSSVPEDTRVRCAWAGTDPLMIRYHDEEWGVAEHDSRALWEKLILDGFQAGLSWAIILRKRDAFRAAFANFDPVRVAAYTEADIARLLADAGIVRSRSKIEAAIGNARAYLAMEKAGEAFADLLWGLAGPVTIGRSMTPPVKTEASARISAALKQRGFKFVGPVIVYAWMQAVGMVDDHAPDCFRCRPIAL
jgi:DNA-3-methyladenine glycosylase I